MSLYVGEKKKSGKGGERKIDGSFGADVSAAARA